MVQENAPPLAGLIVEEQLELSLDELCNACAVERHRIVELVEEGVLETRSITEWRFGGQALRRARTALRLQRDLDLNVAGVALAIELMERIELLERQLRR
jgi:chaperone modulatory protein CbpM